jgi:23S rRNA (uridine2552-2'-O)-methyltransferase
MRLADARRDHYRRLAKDQGYRSRAAYKLKQINDSYRILRKGSRILDIGCAPGGWVQVASEIAGPGRVAGIDIKPVEPVAGATILQGSIDDPAAVAKIIETLGGEKADIILSDLAPNVSGIWEMDHAKQIDLTRNALALAKKVLRPGGSAVFKVFEGEFLSELKKEMAASFGKVLISKPTASRQESSELYLVCLNFHN